MPKEHEWTYQEIIDIEIRRLARKLIGKSPKKEKSDMK